MRFYAEHWMQAGLLLNRHFDVVQEKLQVEKMDRKDLIQRFEKVENVFTDGVIDVMVLADDFSAMVDFLKTYFVAEVYKVEVRLNIICSSFVIFSRLIEFLTKNWDEKTVSEIKMHLIHSKAGPIGCLADTVQNSRTGAFVIMSQYVRVYDFWLNGLLECVDIATAVVSANSNRLTSMPSGLSASTMAQSMMRTVEVRHSTISFPREGCFLIPRLFFDLCGGLDVEYYKPGGGEFLDYFMKANDREFKLKLAEHVWVFDESVDYKGLAIWEPNSRFGFYRFLCRYTDKALQAHKALSAEMTYSKSIAEQFKIVKENKIDVIFVFREATVCGLVLAVIEICNGLNLLGGWNAFFVCTRLEEPEKLRMHMNFSPMVFESNIMLQKYLAKVKSSVIIANLWNLVEDVRDSKPDESNQLIYFVQDDERRFRSANGAPYVEPEKVEDAWKTFSRVVVNSRWVQKELKRNGISADRIGIGVNTALFDNSSRVFDDNGTRVISVMAHCRKSTPRRGWAFIAEVFNRLSRSMDIEFITYDEMPDDLRVAHHHHLGKIAPHELARYMRDADIFFEGSEFQGWGMQALEAMSCGMALVSTNNDGIHEFATNGFDCVVVEHGNVEQAAAVIAHLAKNVDERKILGNRARQTALDFDWGNICKAWNEFLHSIL